MWYLEALVPGLSGDASARDYGKVSTEPKAVGHHFGLLTPVDQQAVKEVVLSGEMSLSNRDHISFLLPSAGGI